MEYWIIINEEQYGPMSLETLLTHDITPETLVWHVGLETWTPASEIAALQGISADNTAVDVNAITENTDLPENIVENIAEEVDIPEIPQLPDFPPIPTQESVTVGDEANADDSQEAEPKEKCPPTNLVWAILAAILCCTPLAIPGIIFAIMVRKKYNRGDYEGAFKASERAALWTILSIVLGLIYQPFSAVISMMTSL